MNVDVNANQCQRGEYEVARHVRAAGEQDKHDCRRALAQCHDSIAQTPSAIEPRTATAASGPLA